MPELKTEPLPKCCWTDEEGIFLIQTWHLIHVFCICGRYLNLYIDPYISFAHQTGRAA
jgi:hypothetical protein